MSDIFQPDIGFAGSLSLRLRLLPGLTAVTKRSFDRLNVLNRFLDKTAADLRIFALPGLCFLRPTTRARSSGLALALPSKTTMFPRNLSIFGPEGMAIFMTTGFP